MIQKTFAVPLAIAVGFWLTGCSSLPPQRSYAARVQERRQASPLAKAVIRTAMSYLPETGVAKAQPKDCSDFVDKVFAANGMVLPRTAIEMSILGRRVASSRDLRMGDLLFFSGEAANRIVGHVAIYVGNGIFIHLSRPEVGVTMESLYSDYYRRRYLTARRVIR